MDHTTVCKEKTNGFKSHHHPLTPTQQKDVQQFIGVFCHYAAAIGTTILASISNIATNMTTSTDEDLKFSMHQFLDYAATHHSVKKIYIASNMKLWVHSDASYLID